MSLLGCAIVHMAAAPCGHTTAREHRERVERLLADLDSGCDRGRVCGVLRRCAVAVGPRRYNRSKLEAYECGIEPTEKSVSGPNAAPGQRFPIKYYLTAMLFIIFDIEIVFLYPW